MSIRIAALKAFLYVKYMFLIHDSIFPHSFRKFPVPICLFFTEITYLTRTHTHANILSIDDEYYVSGNNDLTEKQNTRTTATTKKSDLILEDLKNSSISSLSRRALLAVVGPYLTLN